KPRTHVAQRRSRRRQFRKTSVRPKKSWVEPSRRSKPRQGRGEVSLEEVNLREPVASGQRNGNSIQDLPELGPSLRRLSHPQVQVPDRKVQVPRFWLALQSQAVLSFSFREGFLTDIVLREDPPCVRRGVTAFQDFTGSRKRQPEVRLAEVVLTLEVAGSEFHALLELLDGFNLLTGVDEGLSQSAARGLAVGV